MEHTAFQDAKPYPGPVIEVPSSIYNVIFIPHLGDKAYHARFKAARCTIEKLPDGHTKMSFTEYVSLEHREQVKGLLETAHGVDITDEVLTEATLVALVVGTILAWWVEAPNVYVD